MHLLDQKFHQIQRVIEGVLGKERKPEGTWLLLLFLLCSRNVPCFMLKKQKLVLNMLASCGYSVPQLCPIFCDPRDCSSPGLSVLHHLPEFAQIHVH